ncbi:CAF1 family ribonuclease-domain-containing protein [Phascolomyces articulosus]|uniref:CAF1 family ribonuclease-domain-containing protein n=1 Tax=Phascolomyces articulosus TaxID=60185 RepID=A0AAD5PDC3_9FUNG|nr:CAF1 family ribonuclease-domain-containing protein [Phascolomyces articulosus]
MEISKHDFVKKFPQVADAILEADCIAIDAEFSGLRLNTSIQSQFDDQQARYNKLCESAKEYSIIQFGVCAFKKKGPREYVAKPFNFYIFGGDTPTVTSNRSFLSSASSLQFLRSHNFDFNKWIDEGIPFYNFAETSTAVKKFDRPGTFVNRQNHVNLNTLPKQQMKFMETTRKSIENWLQTGNTAKPLIIQTNNSFIRRLIHQELQDGKYNGYLSGRLRDTKHMSIHKMTEEERKENMRTDHVQADLNFRRVIELINQADCPVVVHNGYLDVLHIIDQFWQYLPSKVGEFKSLATEMWSRIVDTKYLAEFHPHLKGCFNTTVLGSLYNTVSTELSEAELSINIADEYDRYTKDDDAQHEAGYDAFMTGSVFIGFARFIFERDETKDSNSNSSDDEEKDVPSSPSEDGEVSDSVPTPDDYTFDSDILTNYYNRIFVARSDIPYVDLVNEEKMPVIEVPNRFYLTNVPEGVTASGIEALYPELRPMSIHWINSSTAWLIVKHDNKIELAKEGVLGEERVKPFLRGSTRQNEGESLSITASAAKIELFGYQQWRTRSEFQAGGNTTITTKEANHSTHNAQNNKSKDSKEEEEEDSKSIGTLSTKSSSNDSGSDEDEKVSEKSNDNKAPATSTTTSMQESFVPAGGDAYDDLGIPMPPSFMRGIKRQASDDDKSDSKNKNKKQR